MKRPSIQVIPGGLLTTGFSERRARRKNLHRQYTTCDTALKNTANPEWMRLPRMCRLTHDELERWAGQRLTRGRIVGAKLFNRADWHAVAGTERVWVEKLVAAAWAEWDGNDLVLWGIDLVGEELLVARLVDKKMRGAGKNAHLSAHVDEIAPCQMAETSHFGDTATHSTQRSDLRSGAHASGPKKKNTTTTTTSGGAGGGGGVPKGRGKPEPETEPDDDPALVSWLALYASGASDEVRERIFRSEAVAEARAAWAELGMRPGGVKKLRTFTTGKLHEAFYREQGGRFRYKPGKFLREMWRPRLAQIRKAEAAARGETGAAAAGDTMSAYLAHIGGEP